MKKIMALLLAAVFVICMFAGCGSSAASASSAAEQATASGTAASEAESETAEAEETAAEPAAEASVAEASAAETETEAEAVTDGNVTYTRGEDVDDRIVDFKYQQDYDVASYRIADPDETIDLDMFFVLNQQYANLLDDYYDNPSIQAIEDITGVHMEYNMVASSEASTQINLEIASGDMNKIIDKFLSNYTAGGDYAIEEDIIYDLTDYLPEYAPDYYAIINATDEVRRATSSDTGRNAAFFNFSELQPGPRMGLFIRQDWLDELGLEVPETYDDFYNVLTAFKDNYACSMPLLMTESGIMSYDLMAAGYDVAYSESDGFYQVDGTVHYSMNEEGLHEYLTMMHQWYEEGLISSDFASISGMAIDEYINTSEAGVWGTMSRMQDTWAETIADAGDDNVSITAIPNAVKEAGDTLHINNTKSYVDKYGASITTACDEDELIAAIKWNNFMYTDLGSLYCNYGIEDVSFTFDEDGIPHYTSLITDDPECSQLQMIFQYLSASFNSVYQSRSGELELADKAAWDVNNDGAYDLPSWMTMTAEEADTYTPVFSDIDTYVAENILKFINGDRDLSEWDEYVADIDAMGIDQCIELKQAAYDRYLER